MAKKKKKEVGDDLVPQKSLISATAAHIVASSRPNAKKVWRARAGSLKLWFYFKGHIHQLVVNPVYLEFKLQKLTKNFLKQVTIIG